MPHLNALAPAAQAAFLADMARLGQAVLEVTGAVRINYAMFGNLEPALHAHVVPALRRRARGAAHRASLGVRLAAARASTRSATGPLLRGAARAARRVTGRVSRLAVSRAVP